MTDTVDGTSGTAAGSGRGGVRVERNGPVTTVIMDRPAARNAVNGPAAAELVAAFDEFDKDDSASVAVLWGDNGTFCAGADLKAFGTPGHEPGAPQRARPDGADADGAVQTGDRRGERLRGGGRTRTRVVVRPARRRGGRGVRGLLPALGRAAHRRRDGAAAAAHRAQSRDGPDPHRPWRRRRRRRWRSDFANAWCRRDRRARPPRRWPPNSPRCRSCACGRTGCR